MNYLYIVLKNVFTIMFAMYPYFVYQVNKIKKSSNKNLKMNIVWILLIFAIAIPQIWLLVNNELANFLMVLFVLGIYYFINANLNHPE